MGSIFFTGDVVEILNLSEDQIYSIRSQTCNFKADPNRDVVGMRYILFVNVANYSYGDVKKPDEIQYRVIEWNHGGHFVYWHPSQFRLYHRPFKNWIKLLCFKVFRKYCP